MEDNTQNNQEMNTDALYGFHSLKGICPNETFPVWIMQYIVICIALS
jgi:hypothetical protein